MVTICTAQWSLYVPHSGHYMYHQFNIHNSTFCPHSVFMCFVWIWEQTAIISLYNINWLVFITETECVYSAVRTGFLYIIQTPLKPSGHYMYRTVVTICTAQWSLYVPHSGHYMYRTVVTICTASLTLNNSTFSPHSVFMCFVWISEQTAIISLYNINWLVCITERGVCLLRGTDWMFI